MIMNLWQRSLGWVTKSTSNWEKKWGRRKTSSKYISKYCHLDFAYIKPLPNSELSTFPVGPLWPQCQFERFAESSGTDLGNRRPDFDDLLFGWNWCILSAIQVNTFLLLIKYFDIIVLYWYQFRWCQLSKWNNLVQTLILAVDNVSATDFIENPDCFLETRQLFEDVVEVCNPRSDGYSLAPALAYTSVSLATQRRVQNGNF